jgi:CSLREA domain-containing protein
VTNDVVRESRVFAKPQTHTERDREQQKEPTEQQGEIEEMYHQIKPTEVFRERELVLLKEAKNRRLLVGWRMGARRTPTKARSTIALAVLGLLAALVVASLMLAASSSPAHAASTTTTFLVNSTADQPDADTTDGKCFALNASCTLRAAIQQANATPGADVIEFAISGGEVHTITPSSPLPEITDQVTINGYSQAGASANTKAVGDDAQLKIELDGTNVGTLGIAHGLVISNSSGSVIRGLVINRFDQGINITGNSVGNRIEGNFIGTNPKGTLDRGNTLAAVNIIGGPSETVVGGSTSDKRNVLSGNGSGIFIQTSSANRIKGNYVGTDKSGTKDLGNQLFGVAIDRVSGTTIGGKTAASRNVISGNGDNGLIINGAQGTKVLGNRIGTTASGTGALGNDSKGVIIMGASDNLVGDGTFAGANTIAFNGLDGVEINGSSSGNEVSRNSIFSNAGLGVDLGNDGVTPNDARDTDEGPNTLQNKPIIRSAKTVSGKTTIKGKLNSNPNKTYTIEFYSNPKGNEGKKFIGETSVTTRRDGLRSFTFTPSRAVAVGKTITATATRNSTGDTSEFSAPKKVVAS